MCKTYLKCHFCYETNQNWHKNKDEERKIKKLYQSLLNQNILKVCVRIYTKTTN
jgi:hypothetical protein